MKNSFGQFDEVSYVAFMEAATEYYDFQTCQRSDGSYYGTAGQCRKGTPAERPEKENSKGGGDGGGSGSFSMTEQNFDDKAFAQKFASISVNDPAMKDFMAVVEKHEAELGASQEAIVATQEKAAAAADAAEARLDKINKLDDKVIAIDDKISAIDDKIGSESGNIQTDKSNMEKVEKLEVQSLELHSKVDDRLAKEFPDYAKARQESEAALDKYMKKTKDTGNDAVEKTEESEDFRKKLGIAGDLRQKKLGGLGYEEIRELAAEKVYSKSKRGINEYSDNETGQGAQDHYRGGLNKYDKDLKNATVKAIEGMQRKYPDFLPGVDAKQFVGNIGVADGSGPRRVQSDEMFYAGGDKTNLAGALQAATVSSAFGAPGSGASTMGERFAGFGDFMDNFD